MKALSIAVRGLGLLAALLLAMAYADMVRVGHLEEATRTLLAIVAALLAGNTLGAIFKDAA